MRILLDRDRLPEGRERRELGHWPARHAAVPIHHQRIQCRLTSQLAGGDHPRGRGRHPLPGRSAAGRSLVATRCCSRQNPTACTAATQRILGTVRRRATARHRIPAGLDVGSASLLRRAAEPGGATRDDHRVEAGGVRGGWHGGHRYRPLHEAAVAVGSETVRPDGAGGVVAGGGNVRRRQPPIGRNRSGNLRLLRELGAHYGFEAEKVEPVRYKDFVVSSRRPRRLIADGRVALTGDRFAPERAIDFTGMRRAVTTAFPRRTSAPTTNCFPPPALRSIRRPPLAFVQRLREKSGRSPMRRRSAGASTSRPRGSGRL